MTFSWDEHYKSGGASGDPADYAKVRDWKMALIRKYVDLEKESVLDVGCGDLQFWDGNLPKHYTGIDISNAIIVKNRKAYPSARFVQANAGEIVNIPSDAVVCFDVLWHIIIDVEYNQTLYNIKNSARNTILIFTWSSDPSSIWTMLLNMKRGGYQKYRDFRKEGVPVFEPEFKLVETMQSPAFKCGSMFVFRRVTGCAT